MFFYTKRMLVVASLCLGGFLLLGPPAWADCEDGKEILELCVDTGLDDCAELTCATPPPKGAVQKEIDARNSYIDHWYFGANERVQLVVQNLNPFRYDYDFRISSKEIEEDGLANFTKLIFPIFAVKEESSETEGEDVESKDDQSVMAAFLVGERDTKEDPTVGSYGDLEGLKKCIDLLLQQETPIADLSQRQLQALDEKLGTDRDTCSVLVSEIRKDPQLEAEIEGRRQAQRLETLRDDIFDTLTLIDEKGGKIHDSGEKGVIELNDAQARCDCLIATAFKLLDATDPAELEENIEEAEAKLEELREALRATDVSTLSAGVSNAAGFVEDLWSDIDKATSALAEARSNLAQIVSTREQIRSILERRSFMRTFEFGGDLKEYTVKIFRKLKSAAKFPSNPYIDLILTFGSPRFAFAIGATFAALEQPDFAIEQGFVRDRDGEFVLDEMGNEKLGRIVALTDGSEDRVTPTFFLHTRVHETTKKKRVLSGIYLSFGVSGNFEDSATVEYLIGPSFAFAKNQFFVTLGYYDGRVKSLRDGFFEGAELPADLADVPVRSDRDNGFAVALSVKVGSLPN